MLKMSNGNEKGIRECEVEYDNVLSMPKADCFGRAVSKLAVAQICESVGFEGFKDSSLDTLTDVVIRFLRDIGKSASLSANLAGRTECNVFDIVRGLEDVRMCESASGVGSCVAGSCIVKEIVEYVEMAEEVPFCQPVPSFPVVRSRKLIPSFVRMSETPPGNHIPPWLPAFPDRHTYVHTPMWNERKSDPQADKIEQARQRRKAERSYFNLHQRLALCNGSAAGPSGPAAVVVEEKELLAEAENENNPFLAKPLQYGEKDVSHVEFPAKLFDEVDKNHASVLDAFAPAIEALHSKQSENGESEEMSLPERRPVVCFKLKAGKKYVCESLDLSLQKKGNGRTTSWFGREEERDEKKRRAEYILRQSMENPTELTQL